MEPPSYNDTKAAIADKNVVVEPNGVDHEKIAGSDDLGPDVASVVSGQDVLQLQDVDPALNMKMHLVNNVRKSYCCLQFYETPTDMIGRPLTRSAGQTTTLSSSSSTVLGTSCALQL